MIIQPSRESRNVTDSFFEAERKRIDILNKLFFEKVKLTENENKVLVWICNWDDFTFQNIVNAFLKATN